MFMLQVTLCTKKRGGGGMKSNYPATQYIGNAQFQGGKHAKLYSDLLQDEERENF